MIIPFYLLNSSLLFQRIEEKQGTHSRFWLSNPAAAETEKVRRDESRSTPAPAPAPPPPRCRIAHVAGDEE
jgi:hypothetical protein